MSLRVRRIDESRYGWLPAGEAAAETLVCDSGEHGDNGCCTADVDPERGMYLPIVAAQRNTRPRRGFVPKSRVRRKAVYTPPPRSQKPQTSPPWLAPAMVACFLLGIIWIALYYVTAGDLVVLRTLGNWNLLIGFGFFLVGFALSTRWR